MKFALSNTLKNIKEKLGDNDNNAQPTVLFTGGGYHIYQPVYCPIALENVTEFREFDKAIRTIFEVCKRLFVKW